MFNTVFIIGLGAIISREKRHIKMDNHKEEMKTCINKDICGGCTLLDMSYAEQLKLKYETTVKKLQVLNIPQALISPIIGADSPYGYRNKIQISFGFDDNDKLLAGFYIPNSRIIVPLTDCLLENKLSHDIRTYFTSLVVKYELVPFGIYTPEGVITNLVIRTNRDLSEAMVIIVTHNEFLTSRKEIVRDLITKFRQIKSIVQNVNNRTRGNILGDDTFMLFGDENITDEVCGLKFRISPLSFFQVNTFQAEKLYYKAIKMAELKPDDIVLDAYCGIGTIGLIAAKSVKQVVGIELIREASDNARKNAELNMIENASFYTGDAGVMALSLIERGLKPNVVFVDPPRIGLSPKFISCLIKAKPERVIYISCNQQTLVRDLQMLSKHFEVKEVQPLDMFPLTDHVETICALKHL